MHARYYRSGGLFYTLWNIWKEPNWCIFNGTRMTYIEVPMLAMRDIRLREMAYGTPNRARVLGILLASGF